MDSDQHSSNKALFCSFSSLCGDIFDQIMLLLLFNIILKKTGRGLLIPKRTLKKPFGRKSITGKKYRLRAHLPQTVIW